MIGHGIIIGVLACLAIYDKHIHGTYSVSGVCVIVLACFVTISATFISTYMTVWVKLFMVLTIPFVTSVTFIAMLGHEDVVTSGLVTTVATTLYVLLQQQFLRGVNPNEI